MSIISQQAWQSSDANARQFETAQPFRHVVIDSFFEPEFCACLLEDFPDFEDRYALNEMGAVGGKAVRMAVRDLSATYKQLDAYLQTPEFLGYVSKLTGIPDLLYDPDYIGGGTHENRDGQSLSPHVDFNFHPRTKTHRRLNLIIYLNPEWDEAWGGNLELHSDPWNDSDNWRTAIAPIFNRAVIFETNEISWHGFEEIQLPAARKSLSRKSFAIYLYTNERPAAETAPAHATIYVPDGLPRDWEAGRTLSDADLTLLAKRFIRLRGQLRYMYDRERHGSQQLAVLERALGEARDAYRLPLQGFVKQPIAPTGVSADGWVSPQFSARVIPQKALRAIEIDLHVPEQIPHNQNLRIRVHGQAWDHEVARGCRSTIVLKINRPAGQPVDLEIHASTYFVPKDSNASHDDRQLAWLLLDARIVH